MKKITVFLLIVALCIPALFACDQVNTNMTDALPSTLPQVTPGGNPNDNLSDAERVAEMYSVSQPTKVVASTKQVIVSGVVELSCSYEMTTGYVGGNAAYVYTSHVESVRTVEDGGKNDEVKPIKTWAKTIEEYVEGKGVRTTSKNEVDEYVSDWNAEAESKAIGKGKMAINLADKYIEDAKYEDHVFTFKIPKANVSSVLGKTYSKYIAGDVQVVITDDGAQITSIELTYNIKGDSDSNVNQSTMYVKVEYSYDIEKITIE